MKKRLICLVLLCLGLLAFRCARAAANVAAPRINENAIVYILSLRFDLDESRLRHLALVFGGLRVGFAVGDGSYIVTAAHCIEDFKNTPNRLHYPLVISRHYGDVFTAELVAVDDEKDIAILKPDWDVHPALQFETSDIWERTGKLVMASYPLWDSNRCGNGTISHRILTETAPLVRVRGDLKQRITVGPVRYAGPGWSGSPFMVPETGNVAGLVTNQGHRRKWFIIRQRFVMGTASADIRSLFEINSLCYKPAGIAVSDENSEKQFQQILRALESLSADQNEREMQIQTLCDALPESLFAHVLAGFTLSDPNDRFESFQRAMELDPECAFARSFYGIFLFCNNQRQQAADQFKYAAELDPANLFAHNVHLQILVDTDPNAAEALTQDFIARWPQKAHFRFEYARQLRNQNRRSEELPVIQKAVELASSDTIPHRYQRYLADSLAVNGYHDAAEQAYNILLQSHQCAKCFCTYAAFLEKIGKSEQAEEIRQKAAAGQPCCP